MKALIVDDDMTIIDVIRDSIQWEKIGIQEVFYAYNVKSAKQIVSENFIDVIVSDIEMPQESGLDFLKWIREQKYDAEFILLTCHEDFSFATNAINYQAAAYLTKPIEFDVLEVNIKKVIVNLKQRRSIIQKSEYGTWMQKNERLVKLEFWKLVLEGGTLDKTLLKEEIKKRNLPIESEKKVYIICTRITHMDKDFERYDKDVLEFMLEGFHSEILTDFVENQSVVKYSLAESLNFVSVCVDVEPKELESRCKKLQEICELYFTSDLTCCISHQYEIHQLSSAKDRIFDLFEYNVVSYGKIFHEKSVKMSSDKRLQILDVEQLSLLVEKKDKARFLFYIKKIFNDLVNCGEMNVRSLYLIKQEIMQTVYSYLKQNGVLATKLFQDDLSVRLSDNATISMIDMTRWINYLLEQTYTFVEEAQQSITIVDKINYFIEQHYPENIDRNLLAEVFFLTPEYLAKLYKKKSGLALNDYINYYRIEKAKELLLSNELKISEISERVGFNSFSYFSTMFKKYTGQSPKQYKAQ